MRRDMLDARVYLGCISDAFGVLEFVDVWVQSLDGLAEAAKASILCNDAVNNTTLDERWKSLFAVSLEAWPGAFIAQRRLRHKCSKISYQAVFWLIVIAYQFAAIDALMSWSLSRSILHAVIAALVSGIHHR